MNDYQRTVDPLVAQALQQAWPTEPAFDPAAVRAQYLPAPVMHAAPVLVYQPQPLPQQPAQPVAPRDPWPARMAGAGVLAAGAGVGAYFFGLGVHAAGPYLWAVAVILAAAGYLKHGTGGGKSGVSVNIRIDNR